MTNTGQVYELKDGEFTEIDPPEIPETVDKRTEYEKAIDSLFDRIHDESDHWWMGEFLEDYCETLKEILEPMIKDEFKGEVNDTIS